MANDGNPLSNPVVQSAIHSVLSRLVASLVNERLALGLYDSKYTRGILVPLNSSFDFSSGERVIFPLVQAPPHLNVVERNDGTIRKIAFLDPEDIPFTLNLGYFSITNSECGKKPVISNLVNGPQLMEIIRSWNKPDLDTPGYDALLLELEDCLENSVKVFSNPPRQPGLKSGYLEWEQSLLDGHATHPVRSLLLLLPTFDSIF